MLFDVLILHAIWYTAPDYIVFCTHFLAAVGWVLYYCAIIGGDFPAEHARMIRARGICYFVAAMLVEGLKSLKAKEEVLLKGKTTVMMEEDEGDYL